MRIGFALVLAIAACALAALLSGCGGGGNPSGLPDPLIRFVNCSPDSNPLDFFINLDNKAPALTFLSSTGDLSTKRGDKDISVQDSTNQIEQDALSFTFADDNKYVSMTVGLENFGAENQKRLRLLAFQYDKNAPNGSTARLLIVHAYMRATGFDTPNIDFQGGNTGTYDPNNPQFKVTDVPFANATPSTLEVDSGVPLIFQARRAGTENVVASDASTTFDAGGIYLALITGVEGGAGVEAPQVKYIKIN